MNHWLTLDTEDLASFPETKKMIRGREISVVVSPYDVPKAVRSYMDGQTNTLVVEFRYLSNEEPTVEQISEGVSVLAGKHSGRIYALRIPQQPSTGNPVHVRLHTADEAEHAIDRIDRRNTSSLNHGMAKRILNRLQDQLFGGRTEAPAL